MASAIPSHIDTIVIGNGPAALILSYILHGHIPYYKGGHPDALLDTKLSKRPNLLDLTPELYAHFQSSLRYSTQALPVNTFLDTLIRPNADTEVNPRSCVEWRFEPDRAVPHLVLGNTQYPGGQWADSPVSASWDIGTLSYAEMLSLPGYTFGDHCLATKQEPMPDFVRPSRREVAEYLRAYPAAVGVADSLRNAVQVETVTRVGSKFHIGPTYVSCDNLILASGIFSVTIPPRLQLEPLTHLHSSELPLLVIGSGFSAADVIISAPPTRKIIHIFKWQPDERPSPLKACHHQAYPEYAGIYRQMKLAVTRRNRSTPASSPVAKRKIQPFLLQRDWAAVYEGFPNTQVTNVELENTEAIVSLRLEDGEIIRRRVGGLEYVVGRRGTLNYLSEPLLDEVLSDPSQDMSNASLANPSPVTISGRTLRRKAETNLEVAANLFIVGSLAGDSLIRHAFGTCVSVASTMIKRRAAIQNGTHSTGQSQLNDVANGDSFANNNSNYNDSGSSSLRSYPNRNQDVSNGHVTSTIPAKRGDHQDLHLDRRKLKRSREIDILKAENELWQKSGWWGGFSQLP